MSNSNFQKEKMSNSKFKRKQCRMFLLQSYSLKSFHILRHFFLNNKKGKNVELKGNNVEQKEKMSTFAKSLFDIFT